jgi:hypothetical protein
MLYSRIDREVLACETVYRGMLFFTSPGLTAENPVRATLWMHIIRQLNPRLRRVSLIRVWNMIVQSSILLDRQVPKASSINLLLMTANSG